LLRGNSAPEYSAGRIKSFYTVPVGETHMTVKHQIPRDIETKYGSRKVFRIAVDGKDYDLAVNEQAPLYRYLISALPPWLKPQGIHIKVLIMG
jgi:hypothetical protein